MSSLHAVFLLMKAGIFAAFLVALGCGMLSLGHRQDLSRPIPVRPLQPSTRHLQALS